MMSELMTQRDKDIIDRVQERSYDESSDAGSGEHFDRPSRRYEAAELKFS